MEALLGNMFATTMLQNFHSHAQQTHIFGKCFLPIWTSDTFLWQLVTLKIDLLCRFAAIGIVVKMFKNYWSTLKSRSLQRGLYKCLTHTHTELGQITSVTSRHQWRLVCALTKAYKSICGLWVTSKFFSQSVGTNENAYIRRSVANISFKSFHC